MNPEILIPVALSASSVGALWLAGRAASFALHLPAAESAEESARRGPAAFAMRRGVRDSECVAVAGNALRYRNGDYGAAWRVTRPDSLLAEEATGNRHFAQLARLLQSQLPGGTVLQYRFSNHADDTGVIYDALARAAAQADDPRLYAPAQFFADAGLAATAERLRREGFRENQVTLWCRVPVSTKGAGYQRGLGAAAQEAFTPTRPSRQNAKKAPGARRGTARRDPLVQRLAAEEASARKLAEEVFGVVQQFAPGENTRLERQGLWQGLYLGHTETARQVPVLPADPTWDIRDLLSQDELQYGPDYVLHGDTPVAVLSLTVPPQPVTFNGILRALTQDPFLRFRYTLLVDYLLQDKGASIKKLERKIWWGTRTPGRTEEGARAVAELRRVRRDLAAPNQALVTTRVQVLVYGPAVRSQADLAASCQVLDERCGQILGCLKALPGADALREANTELRLFYPSLLPGALAPQPNGLEFDEVAPAVASLAPLDGSWHGQREPHTLLENIAGELVGLNLFDSTTNAGVLGLVLGRSGSGKSVFAAKLALDVLGRLPNASVVAMDFGETYAPAVQAVGGRQIRFQADTTETINIWEYEGLADGVPPSEEQVNLVLGFLMLLIGQHEGLRDYQYKAALALAGIKATYTSVVGLNGPGLDYTPPTLSDFCQTFANFSYEGVNAEHQREILTLLEQWRGNTRLDAPTSPGLRGHSRFDVYELDSLGSLSKGEQNAIAYVMAARMQAATRPGADGKYKPRLALFDEMHNIPDKYPGILAALNYGARQGRKTNMWTLLCTHSHHDLAALHGLTANAGLRIIGQLEGDKSTLIKEAGYTPAMQEALNLLNNEGGAHQFLVSYGSGANLKGTVVNVQLSPLEYWTFTSAPVERNARTAVAQLLRAGEPLLNALAWLAEKFPQGLVKMGLQEIPAPLLAELARSQAALGAFGTPRGDGAAGQISVPGEDYASAQAQGELLSDDEITAFLELPPQWWDGTDSEAEVAADLAALVARAQALREAPAWLGALQEIAQQLDTAGYTPDAPDAPASHHAGHEVAVSDTAGEAAAA